jgi:hypothetical protein
VATLTWRTEARAASSATTTANKGPYLLELVIDNDKLATGAAAKRDQLSRMARQVMKRGFDLPEDPVKGRTRNTHSVSASRGTFAIDRAIVVREPMIVVRARLPPRVFFRAIERQHGLASVHQLFRPLDENVEDRPGRQHSAVEVEVEPLVSAAQIDGLVS